jgi:hypothetical protein
MNPYPAMASVICVRLRVKKCSQGEPGIHRPATTAASVSATPMAEPDRSAPLFQRYM